MPRIEQVRCVLLSSPYADCDEPEVKVRFPKGPKRTIGMVEVALDNGITGLGEGYMAVFAPMVFRELINLCRPYLEGREGFEIERRVRDLCNVSDYWSLQGAARHTLSAFECALHDAKAKSLGVPVHEMLGGADARAIRTYGSGGCCDTPERFQRELDLLAARGITLYKIRATRHDVHRTVWILKEAAARGIEVAVDMCQNLADPAQDVDEVVAYIERVQTLSGEPIAFIEEAVGPDAPQAFKALRSRIDVPVAGGEIITTPNEMIGRMAEGAYDLAQPDASVIGGIGAVLQVFEAARQTGTSVVVHAWGGAAARMANYHAAFAGGGKLVEYPMLDFPLGATMIGDQAVIEDGMLRRPEAPGLGLRLTPEIEAAYPFDEAAVYSCTAVDVEMRADETWATT